MKQTNTPGLMSHHDLSAAFRSHLVGERHSRRHKFIFGIMIASFGVMVSEFLPHFGIEFIAVVGHHIGYGIHGLGYIPIYKAIEGGRL